MKTEQGRSFGHLVLALKRKGEPRVTQNNRRSVNYFAGVGAGAGAGAAGVTGAAAGVVEVSAAGVVDAAFLTV